FRAITQDKNIAFAGYLPTLDFVAAAGREKTNSNSTNNQDVYLNRTEMAFILQWNLFRGGADKLNISRQDSRISAASYRVMEAINEKTLETAQAYLAALKEMKLLELAKENVEVHDRLYNQIQQRIDAGIGAQSELEQAASRLALAESNLVATQNNFDDAVVNFEKVYGSSVNPEAFSDPANSADIPENFALLLEQGQQNNPSLKVQRANIDVATKNYHISKAAYLPVIDLEAKQSWNKNIGGVEGDDDSSSIMLRFTYNLYNGGADDATHQKRISELAKEKEVFSMMERQNKERLGLAWNAYTMIDKQMGYIEKHRDLSEKTLSLYNEEFGLGRRTLLDILDTEGEYYGAQRELVTAKYDKIFAKYRIFEQTGTLLQVAGTHGLEMVGMADTGVSKADELDTISH
ncbi:TolC family outer membrane protein, partial [Sulfurospirillum sp. T05]